MYLGSLVQFCCREGGKLQISLVCGECLQCLDHPGFAPVHGMCVFPVYTAQAPGCFVKEMSKWDPVLRALPRSSPLRFIFSGTLQRHRLSWACISCPSQVWAAHVARCLASADSPAALYLITSMIPAILFPECIAWVQSQVCHMSPMGSWSLAVTLLVDMKCPGSQEDVVSNCSQFGRGCCPWGRVSPLPFDSGCLPPASLPLVGDGLVHSWLGLLWYLLSHLFCQRTWQCLRLELFTGKFSHSLFPLFTFSLSDYPMVWVAISC